MTIHTAESTSRFIEVMGINIHYHDTDVGDRILVMLHGGGPGASAWSNYRTNLPVLAAKYRVIAFDAPHYGDSDKPMSAYQDTDYYADVFAQALDQLGVKAADFVGNSMGGTISLTLAMKWPGLVQKLVLMGPGGSPTMFTPMMTEGIKILGAFYQDEGPTRDKLEAAIRIMVYDQSMVTPELIDARFKAATHPDLLRKREWKGHPMLNLWKRLVGSPLEKRTLLIYGKEDRVIPWDSSLLLMRLLPNASLHVFPRCGHWAQLEKADEFNTLVAGFLEQPHE
ncbi:alpha/beta hydrolase [Pseudomonas poae]|nr:alpha/beta hydrolase [Pseudomonas poae]